MFNNRKKIEELENMIKDIQDEVDFLHNLIVPYEPPPEAGKDYEYKSTIELTEEIYDIIYEYSENKNFIFMGVC